MSERLLKDVPVGATISDISPLPSDPNVQRIKVGGRIVARLSGRDVEQLNLEPGQEWTDELAERVAHQVARAKARKTALNALGRRSLSRGQLIERLQRRGHDADAAASVADELEADGWLDDAAYARELAESLCRSQPASQRLIVHKLVQRKFSRDLAERVAAEVLEGTDAVEQAMEFAEKRYRSMQSLSPAVAVRRIAGALARRGFDHSTTREVIARLGILDEDR